MWGDIPKQFLPVGGKPVLMRTIEAFYAFDAFHKDLSTKPAGSPEELI